MYDSTWYHLARSVVDVEDQLVMERHLTVRGLFFAASFWRKFVDWGIKLLGNETTPTQVSSSPHHYRWECVLNYDPFMEIITQTDH